MKQDYIVITRDMLELGLRGSRLLVYALVYSFSRDAESDYHGSLGYVAEWCGVSRGQASDILKALVEEGYLDRDDREGRPHYTVRKTERSENRTDRSENRTLPPHTPSSQESKERRKDIDTLSSRAREEMYRFGDKVEMSRNEHANLVERFGAADAHRLCEILDDYLVNHPRKRYASHYRAILSWCVTRLREEQITAQRLQNAKEAGQRVNGQQPQGRKVTATTAELDAKIEAIAAKYRK